MGPLKISYTYYAKYKDHLYCRVRQAGVKTFDVNLHTNDKAQAENFIRLRRAELDLYNRYVLAGEPVPEEVERKILRRGSPAIAQKGASEAVSLLTTAMDGWEQDLRLRGKREATISTYEKQVRLTIPEGATVADFTIDNVQAWLTKFASHKTSTKKAYSVSLREFGKFLVRHHGVAPAVLDNWPMTKVLQEERGYWTMQEMRAIIEAIECKDKQCEEAMKAYCWVMATTGSRQGETGLLRWSDFRDGALTYRAETTKNNVTRRVPLEMRVCEMLLRLPRRGTLIFEAIPPSQAGRYAILARAVRKAKMPHGGLHTFRHSASMLLYSKCKDIKAAAQLLGHSESVALKYYQASRQSDELRKVVDKAFSDENMIPSTLDLMIDEGLI